MDKNEIKTYFLEKYTAAQRKKLSATCARVLGSIDGCGRCPAADDCRAVNNAVSKKTAKDGIREGWVYLQDIEHYTGEK